MLLGEAEITILHIGKINLKSREDRTFGKVKTGDEVKIKIEINFNTDWSG